MTSTRSAYRGRRRGGRSDLVTVRNPQPVAMRDTANGGIHVAWRGRCGFIPFGPNSETCPCGGRNSRRVETSDGRWVWVSARWVLCLPCEMAILGNVPPPVALQRPPTPMAERTKNWKKPTPDEHRLSKED